MTDLFFQLVTFIANVLVALIAVTVFFFIVHCILWIINSILSPIKESVKNHRNNKERNKILESFRYLERLHNKGLDAKSLFAIAIEEDINVKLVNAVTWHHWIEAHGVTPSFHESNKDRDKFMELDAQFKKEHEWLEDLYQEYLKNMYP